MRELLIATRSKGKLPEITAILEGLPFEFLGLNDTSLPKDYEVEESAFTFEGNAIIKAMMVGNKTGLLTLAEDAGLEVDALDGRPGVFSRRYAPGSDKDRYRKLLGELEGVPEEKRTARFVAVTAIYDPERDKVRTCKGVCEGKITIGPKGSGGFGYDPIFFCTELGKTNAEASPEEKNKTSHRGHAMRQARVILEEEFNL